MSHQNCFPVLVETDELPPATADDAPDEEVGDADDSADL